MSLPAAMPVTSIAAPQHSSTVTVARKRLALFLDGTWNEKETQTNVWRLYMQTADIGSDGVPQVRQYFKGVGTRATDRFTGGLLAAGLTDVVRKAYLWLVEFFNDGDEIYVFGFSRGAFEVRSLVGMIGACGLMNASSPLLVTQLWERYKRCHLPDSHRNATTNIEQVLARGAEAFPDDIESRRMAQYCCQVKIQFVGMFDVVSADPASHEYTHGQNARLLGRVCHAMAIDEHRRSFQCDYCTSTDLLGGEHSALIFADDSIADESFSKLEQRWFIGCHSNVGGGYVNDELSQIPLKWMRDCAQESGLGFRSRSAIVLDGKEHLRGQVTDSLTFAYLVAQFGQLHYREIGSLHSLNETIDATVLDRMQYDATYRPPNVIKWARRLGIGSFPVQSTVLAASTGRPV